jgi:molybdopterin synthase catalytic subunit
MQTDWIELTSEPLDAGAVVGFVTAEEAGGIAVFLGTTRAEKSGKGQALAALHYDAYAEMARKQMGELAVRVREKWPVERLAILHRVGRVNVGEPSVIIGVSTGHRAEAFEACRWVIDTLKAEAAIWKKEVWGDGTVSWVHPLGEGMGEA